MDSALLFDVPMANLASKWARYDLVNYTSQYSRDREKVRKKKKNGRKREI